MPTAALRFVPAPVAAATGPAKKSFVQSLIPMPTRNRSRPAAGDASPASAGAGAHIWVLRNGQPESIMVKLGLSDGRMTEISGAGLAEGLVVILRANPPPA